MHIFPIKEYCLVSDLKPGELIERVQGSLKSSIGFGKAGGFRGKTEGQRFKIYYVKVYRKNSFQPVYYGEIGGLKKGSSGINVIARVHLFARIFMSLWLGILLLIVLRIIWSSIANGLMPGLEILFVLPFMVFGFGLPYLGFNWGLTYSENELMELLCAKPQLPADRKT